MSLIGVWSEGSLAHDPEGEVWIGVRIEGDETAERGRAMQRAIVSAGLEVVTPDPYPDTEITAVHDPGMLDYLATAYGEWVAAGYPEDPGQDLDERAFAGAVLAEQCMYLAGRCGEAGLAQCDDAAEPLG